MELNRRGTPRNWCHTRTSEISGEVRELGYCPSAAGVAKFLGSLRRAREEQTKAWEESWGQKALALGLLECVPGRTQGSGRRCPGSKSRHRAVGQQKPKSCALHGCGAHSYRALGTDRASEGPRGPGLEEDELWEPSAGALAGGGGGGGCSCVGSRSVIRAW